MFEGPRLVFRNVKSGARYDLIIANLNLTDVNELSGLEILEYIRDHRPSLPRIVITGKPVRGPIYSTLFEGYQITEFMTKGEINIPELRQLVRNILMPLRTGTPDYQERKERLLDQLKKRYDDAVSRLSEGLKALDAYEARLRREVGQHQAEELTRPDKTVLTKKREDYKIKYDSLFSRTLVCVDSVELNNIEEECANEW